MTGLVGLPAQSSYCATKAAVKGLTESLWAEWGAAGIGVTSVHPGAIKTDMMRATLKDSDDIAAAEKNIEMVAKIGMAPDVAAEKILRAVQKKKSSGRKRCCYYGCNEKVYTRTDTWIICQNSKETIC